MAEPCNNGTYYQLRSNRTKAVKALILRLNQDSLMAAVQDFRYACQQDNKMVVMLPGCIQ